MRNRDNVITPWISTPFVLICLLLTTQCAMHEKQATEEEWQSPRVVQIKGVKVNRCFTWLPTWGAAAGTIRPVGLLLRDGDLIYCNHTQHGDFLLPYRGTDGNVLKLDVRDGVIFLNGRAVWVELEEGGTGWEWLRSSSPEDLSDLRFLHFKDPPDAPDFPLLEKVASVRPDVGLSVGEIDSPEAMGRLFSLFEPHFLVIETSVLSARIDALAPRLTKLEHLYSDGEGSMDFLPRLPRLRTLRAWDWSPEESGAIPAGIRSLRTLHIMGGDDLSFLRSWAGIEELVLWAGSDLKDITALAAFLDLKKLVFSGGDNISDLSVLDRLPKLAWLELPEGTTQEAFAGVIATHPGLEVIELDSEHIRDLSPLRQLRRLKALILLHENNVDADTLRDLKGLRYLALPEEAFEDEAAEQTAALEHSLPDTFVAQAGPFCLGSGWILLLVPAIILFQCLRSRGYCARNAADA